MVSTSIAIILAAAAVSLNPPEDVASDQVDLIEVNHFYDEQGRLVLDQIIFYDWSSEHNRYNVCAWRLLKNPAQIPQRNWRLKDYVAVWRDGPVLRKVRAKTVRETWTQYDPELVQREFLPKDKRRELQKIARKTTAK